MSRFRLAVQIAVAVSLWAGNWRCPAQQVAHPLPQAFPGTHYAAQLAIPPGLGYPFSRCELLGQTPRWLTLDCARLQLKGKVPTVAARDGDIEVTLRIEDNSGNSRSFPLLLRVSTSPQVVNLAEPEGAQPSPPPNENAANLPARPVLTDRVAPVARATNDDAGEPIPPGDASAASASSADSPTNQQSAFLSTPSGEAPLDDIAAAQLGNAAAQLRAARITLTKPASSARRNTLLRGAHPTGLHAQVGADNCASSRPSAGDPPVAQEARAIEALESVVADCDKPASPECIASVESLETAAAQAWAGTTSCANNGKDAEGSTISRSTEAWYQSRANLWENASKNLKAQGSRVKAGKYQPLPKQLVSDLENPAAAPSSAPAGDEFNLGLARYYFLGGTLLSQQQDQFSHADLFLGFHLDRVLRAPELYLPKDVDANLKNGKYLVPGLSTLLDIRLTSLPVAVQSCPSTSTTCSNKSTGSSFGATTANQAQVFLNSQKAARFEGGVYLPYQLRHWRPSGAKDGDGYVVDFAPIAKIGFDTSMNGLNQTQQSSNTPATVQPTGSSNSFYKFYDYGGRLVWNRVAGNAATHDDAPELVGYIDIGIGRFSNLATLLCPASQAPCATNAGLNHQFQYRIPMEGLLDIPGAAGLSIGFSANLAQRGIGAHHYDLLPPDDLRFLFGYKVDVTKLFKNVFPQ